MTKSYTITIQGETFHVDVLQDPRLDQVQVRINGEILTVDVYDTSRNQEPTFQASEPPPVEFKPLVAAAPSPAAVSPGSGSFGAPLPGTVIQVSAKPGQKVVKGDELFVIEAMKMNNKIRSPRDGVVGQVYVQAGENVNHGSLLMDWAE